MTIEVSSGSDIVVSAPSSTVLLPAGIPGPPGAGVELAGAVPVYDDLPDDLGVDDAGAAYVVQDNGKLYVWSGLAWPTEENGADFRGEHGRGVTAISVSGGNLDFVMSDTTHEIVTVPAISAAAASATAAAASATAADGSKTAAATSASDAASSASTASTAASNASTSASNASGSATAAAGSASAASGSASSASTSATDAASSASAASASETAAADSASAALASKGAAAASESAAAGSASAANASAVSAESDADAADAAKTAAAGSASAASTSAGTASSAASTATTKASEAASSASVASGAESNASGSASAASASAAAAAASETNAASSASAAASSESNAATSESNAADSADAAAQSAQEAADAVNDGVANATATTKGGIMLPGGVDGELGGTFDHPVVHGWANKADLVAGKIPVSQIPSLATTEVFVVSNQAGRLALTCETGDVAVQDGNPGRGTYILQGDDPSDSADWVLMTPPDGAVSSVNGYTGIVVLGKADVGLANVDNTSDASKPVSSAQQTALDGKVPNSRTVSAGTGLTGGGDLSTNRTLAVSYGTTSGTAAQGNDSRLTDTRTPTDGSVTAPKFASGVLPHDMTVVQFSDGTVRATGLGDLTLGVCVQRAFTLKGVRYRFATADASGNTVVELRKNGTQISGTSKTVAAADQLGTSGSAREITGLSVAVAKGDVITAYITGVGTTPGKGLYVDVEGVV